MSGAEGYWFSVARERLGGCFQVVGGAWKRGRAYTYCPFREVGWFLGVACFLYLWSGVVVGVNVCDKVETLARGGGYN